MTSLERTGEAEREGERERERVESIPSESHKFNPINFQPRHPAFKLALEDVAVRFRGFLLSLVNLTSFCFRFSSSKDCKPSM